MLSPYAQQTMVDTLPIAACVFTGPDHIIEAVNQQMLAIWNKDTTIIGKPLLEAVPDAGRNGFSEFLTRVYQTGDQCRNPEGQEMTLIKGKPEPVYFDYSFKPLCDREGVIYGVVSTAVDITARVKAVIELEQTIEELAATNEELSALNEEYLSLNEELEAGSEELRATNDEMFVVREALEKSLAELEDSEERLLLAADAVNLGTFDVDLQKGMIVTSGRMDKIFGFPQTAALSDYENAIHEEDRSIREHAMKSAMQNGQLFYEARLVRPDGGIIWARVEGKVLHNQQGQPVRIIGTVFDFTEHRHDKEIQRKLKALADNSVDLMALLGLDGKNSYINEAGKKLLGFTSDLEVQETPISELHTPEDFIYVQEQVLSSVMSQGKWTGVMQVRHLQTKEVFPVLNYTIRIDDPISGKPIGIGAIMRDLRPELAAKKALADSEQMLRNVTSAAPTALWLADQAGSLTYVNQTWTDWTGLSLEKSKKVRWLEIVHPEDLQRITEIYLDALDKEQAFEAEYRTIDAAGCLRWFSTRGKPQFNSDQHFSGHAGVCIDITSQKELQKQKDDFISIASHELKTPITSLKAAIQLLNKYDIQSSNPLVPKLLLQAGKSVDQVSALIDDLLNVSRLQQQQLKLNKTKFILGELLTSCASPIELASRQEVRISGDVDLEVFADEHQIAQVVTNFLTNAIKYAPDSVIVEVRAEQQDGHLRVSVTDHGQGIPPNRLKNLFERFYRVEETIHQASGLGLGLYISAEIIQRHGGKIGAESDLGKGSTFWFSLPLLPSI